MTDFEFAATVAVLLLPLRFQGRFCKTARRLMRCCITARAERPLRNGVVFKGNLPASNRADDFARQIEIAPEKSGGVKPILDAYCGGRMMEV